MKIRISLDNITLEKIEEKNGLQTLETTRRGIVEFGLGVFDAIGRGGDICGESGMVESGEEG